MRLLFVSNFYPPLDRGGYEKHCQEIADGLQSRGHRVCILTSRYGVTAPIQVGTVTRSLFLEAALDHYRPVDFFLRRRQEERYNHRVLLRTIASVQPDLIVFWGMWNLTRNLPITAENMRQPVAYWIGDLWPVMADMHTRYWRSTPANRVLQSAMAITAQVALGILHRENPILQPRFEYVACGSQFLKQQLSSTIPNFNRAKVVLCGVDLDLFSEASAHQRISDCASPRVVYIGALTEQKGVHTLIKSAPLLTDIRPSIKPQLTIVGGGPLAYVEQLRQLVQDLRISDQVTFQGVVLNAQVPLMLKKQDILVAPSVVQEGFGRVLVEGMAAGLVVLSTATGAGGEIVQHEANGLVFPPEDAATLAQCLLRLIEDPTLYARLAQAGKASAVRFSLKRMIDEMEQFFLETIAIVRREA